MKKKCQDIFFLGYLLLFMFISHYDTFLYF